MAMNKSEKAMLERALTESALRWTEKVSPDVPPPTFNVRFGESTTGWIPRSTDAVQAWSESAAHGVGSPKRDRYLSARQNSVALYSTKVLALKSLRNLIEEDAAARLRHVDRLIEEANSNPAADQGESK